MIPPGELLSVNLARVDAYAIDAAKFDAPLVISPGAIIGEIVYWDPRLSLWVFLVREHTTRAFPPGSVEVTVDELAGHVSR